MKPYTIFWGDTHHNTYQTGLQEPSIAEVLEFARTYLDFYSGAYYTPIARDIRLKQDLTDAALPKIEGHQAEQALVSANAWKGIRIEHIKDPQMISRHWQEFQQATATHNVPGQFVTFPGYEWQGDGSWGDHNVIYKNEGPPVHLELTLPELYERLREHDALAIPHHIGYHTGIRAPRWDHCDERISPFAEIYSVHGCSETDEEWIGLRNNPHMGPALGGSTYQAALNRGLHLGAICSTDNWTNMPGHWGQGLMACLATDLTRESLWDAFRQRRVYGVTGDRIELDFTCNGQPMGSILDHTAQRHLQVGVRGQDAIDRIEILRNDRVIATYCHQGNWSPVSDGQTSRFKLRVECGWGPRIGEFPVLDQLWNGEMVLSQGRFVGWSPCWVTRGQTRPVIDGGKAQFLICGNQATVSAKAQNAVILEFEAQPSAELAVRINGQALNERVGCLAQGSRLLWSKDECLGLLEKMTGLKPEEIERLDPLYHYAFKSKLHRVIPEAGYSASFSITDTDRLDGEAHYRVRVEQRNGQRAWSSPIWLEADR